MFKNILRSHRFHFFLLVLISALVYLPTALQAGFYRDEWYFILDGVTGGSQIFRAMFQPDRPARGVFFEIYFWLFREYPLPYHLGNYFWRVAAALALYWLFRLLWKRTPRMALVAALLILVYPGYLWWISGLEYQPMMVSLFLEIISIGFSVKFVTEGNHAQKAVSFLIASTTGLLSLALVEYAIGMEVLRLACIVVVLLRNRTEARTQALSLAMRGLALLAAIPSAFVFWRFFIFENNRPATDFGMQVSVLFDNTLLTLASWAGSFFQSSLNIAVLAWFVPFEEHFFDVTNTEQMKGFFFAIPILAVFALFLYSIQKYVDEPDQEVGQDWRVEAMWIGALGTLAGVVPVVLSNRTITFDEFSHYALPAVPAAVIFLTGWLAFITSPKIRALVLTTLVGLAALTHYAVGLKALHEEEIIRQFWWQVYWRAPQLEEGTTLAVYYPGMPIREDFDNIWGPANLLYYSDLRDRDNFINFPLAAISLMRSDIESVVTQAGPEWWHYRTHGMTRHFDKVLVLQQPTTNACMQVLDKNALLLSQNTPLQIEKLANYSNTQVLLSDSSWQTAPHFLFRAEPPHGWCYYYQKIGLALQNQDWETAARLGDEALKQNMTPKDNVEWLPLLRAYAITGNQKNLNFILQKLKKDDHARRLTCQSVLVELPKTTLSQEAIQEILADFCLGVR